MSGKALDVPEGMETMTVDPEADAPDAEEGTPEAVTSLRLEPLHDFVIIFPDTEKKYKGAVQLIDDRQAGIVKTKFRGLVVAAGPECENVEDGHYVYFWKHAGSIQFIEDQEFRVCRENEIFAIDRRSQEEMEGPQSTGPGDKEGNPKSHADRAKSAEAAAARVEKTHLGDDGWG